MSSPVPIPFPEEEVFEKLRLIESGASDGILSLTVWLDVGADPPAYQRYIASRGFPGHTGPLASNPMMLLFSTKAQYNDIVNVVGLIPKSIITRIEYTFIPHAKL